MNTENTVEKKRTVYASLQEWVRKALETVAITSIEWNETAARAKIDGESNPAPPPPPEPEIKNIYPFAQFIVIGSKNVKSRARINRITDENEQTTMYRSIRGTQTLIGELSIYDTSYQSLIDTAVSLGDLASTTTMLGKVRILEDRVEAFASNVLRCTITVEFERDIYTDVPIKVVQIDKVRIEDPLNLSEKN